MPYCTSCGANVDGGARYCAKCGSAQPAHGATQPAQDFLASINERTASVLCYIPVAGIVPSIVFLASQRFRHNQRVRFDAFQSIYLFVAWLILGSVTPFWIGFFHAGLMGVAKLAAVVCWVYLLVKASQNERVHLPILGDLAARSAAEQL